MSPLRVLFLHGLESGPSGRKVAALRKSFEAVECVDMSRYCHLKKWWWTHPYLIGIPVFLGALVYCGMFLGTVLGVFPSSSSSATSSSSSWSSGNGKGSGSLGIQQQLFLGLPLLLILLYVATKGVAALLWHACDYIIIGCLDLQRKAIDRFQPDVLVGSSFGGAVAVFLALRGGWRGPLLLLAPAHAVVDRVTNRVGYTALPPPSQPPSQPQSQPQPQPQPRPESESESESESKSSPLYDMSNMGACVVVHGTRDDVVPIKDSIFMAEAVPGNKVKVVSVDDRHSLPKACPRLLSLTQPSQEDLWPPMARIF